MVEWDVASEQGREVLRSLLNAAEVCPSAVHVLLSSFINPPRRIPASSSTCLSPLSHMSLQRFRDFEEAKGKLGVISATPGAEVKLKVCMIWPHIAVDLI